MLKIAIGDQRCLTSSRVSKIASLRRLTVSRASAPVALATGAGAEASAHLDRSLALYRRLGCGPGGLEALVGTIHSGAGTVAEGRLLGAIARLREGLDLRWTPPRSRDELHER